MLFFYDYVKTALMFYIYVKSASEGIATKINLHFFYSFIIQLLVSFSARILSIK